MRLECVDVACGYGARVVLRGVDLSVAPGEVVCVLGPNGVGKTTLFKTALGVLPLLGGAVRLDGRPLAAWSRRARARVMAYVPQAHAPVFPFTVGEVVLMGRHAHLGPFASPGAADRGVARDALERLGIGGLWGRAYTDLSGGERQLVLVARALAQQASLFLMDEPTSSLDFGNQVRVLAQVRDLARAGIGVLMTTHSPNHALACGTRVVLVGADGGLTVGAPVEVLTAARLAGAFGVEVHLTRVPARPGAAEGWACVPLLPPVESG